jgi:predicted DNA-binding transcriptional regulator YafY
MRADRLIALALLLQARGKLTAQRLAARLEVSVRTIHRDLVVRGRALVELRQAIAGTARALTALYR